MNDVPQLAVLLACLTAGIAAGALYEVNCAARALVRRKWACIAADVLFFAAFACLFALLRAAFYLPGLRVYMLVAALFGFWLYHESLHRILAFFTRKLYNKCRSGAGRFPILCLRPKAAHGRKEKKAHRRITAAAVVLLAILLIFWIYQMIAIGSRNARIDELNKQIDLLTEENKNLSEESEQYKTNLLWLERAARELGMLSGGGEEK